MNPSTTLSPSFFFSSRRRHTRSTRDWSSDVCSSDLPCHSPCGLRNVLIPSADPGEHASEDHAPSGVCALRLGETDRHWPDRPVAFLTEYRPSEAGPTNQVSPGQESQAPDGQPAPGLFGREIRFL